MVTEILFIVGLSVVENEYRGSIPKGTVGLGAGLYYQLDMISFKCRRIGQTKAENDRTKMKKLTGKCPVTDCHCEPCLRENTSVYNTARWLASCSVIIALTTEAKCSEG